MLYFFYYIERANPDWYEPWKIREGVPKICVSGDDVCIIVNKNKAAVLVESIKSLTATNSRQQNSVGLGQVMKSCDIRPWFDIDFCSKWGFWDGSTLESF